MNYTRKPRLLIPLTIQFSVRYILRTDLLDKIRQYADLVIVLGWEDPQLVEEIRQMGVEVHQNPGKQVGLRYARIRKKLDLWHFDHVQSPSTEIDRRRNALLLKPKYRLRSQLRIAYFHLSTSTKLLVKQARQKELELLRTDTNFNQHLDLLRKVKPDAVLSITPFFLEEEFLIRAAHASGIRTVASILSFDNITTRGWMPVIFDHYCLWNEFNKKELYRIYPQTLNREVSLVGAPQFDFYYDKSYLWSESVWRENLGIPPGRSTILFGAGPHAIAPLEPHWLLQLDQAIENGRIHGNPIILFRQHPVDSPARWDEVREKSINIIFDKPWALGKDVVGKTNVSIEDIKKLASTLAYTDVHINTSSTMTIDGAIFDKPQIGPAYDDQPGQKFHRAMIELYEREHFLPITRSGGLEIAASLDEMISLVNHALADPKRLSEKRKVMVREICTYTDGKSSDRVAAVIKEFLANATN